MIVVTRRCDGRHMFLLSLRTYGTSLEMPRLLFKKSRGDVDEITLRHNSNEPALINHWQAVDLFSPHQRNRIEGQSLRNDRQRVSRHYRADRQWSGRAFAYCARKLAQNLKASDQSDQSALLVFNREVPNSLPFHQAGNQVERLVLVHPKQVCSHKLFNALIALFRHGCFRYLRKGPLVYWPPLSLSLYCCGDERSQGLVLRSVFLHLSQGPQLPLRSRLPRAHALFNHTQISIDVRGDDTRSLQSVARDWQKITKDQVPHRNDIAADPGQLRIETETRSGLEVRFGIVKLHRIRNIVIFVRNAAHQPEEESRVGDLVDNSRTCRESTGFDSKVGAAVGDAIARPIPPPDCAVVDPKRLQLRHQSLGEQFQRVFVERRSQEDPEPCYVLLKKFQYGALHPFPAEADPRAALSQFIARMACVNGLLE